MPLVLCDTMGLEEMAETGLDIEDLINIYQGHVKDRYQVSETYNNKKKNIQFLSTLLCC